MSIKHRGSRSLKNPDLRDHTESDLPSGLTHIRMKASVSIPPPLKKSSKGAKDPSTHIEDEDV